jgi:hypothetical protein
VAEAEAALVVIQEAVVAQEEVALVHSRTLAVKVATSVWVALVVEVLIQAVVEAVADSKMEYLRLEQQVDQALSSLVTQILLRMRRL